MGGSPGLAVDTLSLARVLKKLQATRAWSAEATTLFLAPAITALIIIAVAYDHCILL